MRIEGEEEKERKWVRVKFCETAYFVYGVLQVDNINLPRCLLSVKI